MELDGEEGGNLENDLAACDDLGEVMDIQPSMVTLRATKMFTEGNGAPCMSKEPPLTSSATLWLVKLAKEAVFELFEHRRGGLEGSIWVNLSRDFCFLACLFTSLRVYSLLCEENAWMSENKCVNRPLY